VPGRILVALATVLLGASCGAQSSGGGGSGSGLYGTVRVSPGMPTCVAGTSCRRPARGLRLVFSANGKTVTATTDHNGRYRVRLDRGRYLVRAGLASGSPKRGLQPRAVTVPRGRLARRDFTYDTGIR
jgi:hypothetical protein